MLKLIYCQPQWWPSTRI